MFCNALAFHGHCAENSFGKKKKERRGRRTRWRFAFREGGEGNDKLKNKGLEIGKGGER